MKKLLLILVCLIQLGFSYAQETSAWQVTPQQALIKAKSFFAKKGVTTKSNMKRVKSAYGKEQMTDSVAPYYVFNAGSKQGFVIISGDERVNDILGYVDSGDFNVDSIPENMRGWLKDYEEAISFIENNSVPAMTYMSTVTTLKGMPAISPILTTQWSQRKPYNGKAPLYKGTPCLTGCVATAMAQVMNHARWPRSSTTSIPSYTTNRQIGELDSLPSTTFDWNTIAMGTGPSFEEEVAKLMRYCGQSVRMNYGTGASLAYSSNVASALSNYFGYTSAQYISRNSYSVSEWDEMIYNEIDNNRAVYYSGQSTGGGHAFVVDGFDGNGLFHINWGWGGYCDGYFKLSVLNPDSNSGDGASSSNDGYSMSQNAVIGIGAGYNLLESKLRCTRLSSNNTSLSIEYRYDGNNTLTCSYGVAIMDDSGKLNVIGNPISATIASFQYKSLSIDLSNYLTTSGTYTIVPVYKNSSSSSWIRTADYKKYATVKVSSNFYYTITIHPIQHLSLEDFTVDGDLKLGTEQVLKFTVKNTGDDYSGTVYCFISSTNEKGNYISRGGIAVESGHSETVDIYMTPPETGILNVWLTADYSGENVIGQSTMTIISDQTEPSALSLKSWNSDIRDGYAKTTFYVHNDGLFTYGRPIYIEMTDAETSEVVRTYTLNDISIASGGTKGWWVSFSGLDNSKIYNFNIYFYSKTSGPERKLAGSVLTIMPEANVSKKHILTITASGGGSVGYSASTINGTTKSFDILDGATLKFIISENEGYRLKSLKVNDNDFSPEIIDDSFSIPNVKTDLTLKATFVPLPTLTIKQTNKGQVKVVVGYGTSRTLKLYPSNGKTLSSVKFNGNDVTTQVSSDYLFTTPMIKDESTLDVVFSHLAYKLTYLLDGKEYKTYGVKFGDEVTPEEYPLKEGHSFSGWIGIPKTMPEHDVTVTGYFSVNKYRLIYMIDDKEYESVEMTYGTNIEPVKEPTKEGYIFSGWSDIPEKMPAHDVVVNGSFLSISIALFGDDIQGCSGSKIILPINLKNSTEVKLSQFDLQLPSGVAVATKSNGKLDAMLTERARSHSISSKKLSNGDYRFVISSLDNESFVGSDGTLVEITLDISSGMADGEYTIKVLNAELSIPNGNDLQVVKPANTESKLTVSSYMPGDVNNDGIVSVTDVGNVINYILENLPSTFIFAAADMNNDNDISVTDVGYIINYILNEGAARGVNDNEQKQYYRQPALKAVAGGYQLLMDNLNSFIGFQLDLKLTNCDNMLDGLQLQNVSSDHILTFKQLADGTYRVVCYSPQNSNFNTANNVLVSILAKGEISLSNIRFTTSSMDELHYGNLWSSTTGLPAMGKDFNFCVQGNTLCIKSEIDTSLNLYNMNGSLYRTLDVQKGMNSYEGVRTGVYLINNLKFIIR